MDEVAQLTKKAWGILATMYIIGLILFVVSFAVIGLPSPFDSSKYMTGKSFFFASGLLMTFGSIISTFLFLKSRKIRPTDSNKNGLIAAIIILLIVLSGVYIVSSIAIRGL